MSTYKRGSEMMKQRIIAAMPLISLTLFLGVGIFYQEWEKAAGFFLLIPLSWIVFSKHPLRRLSDFMIIIALGVFLWIGITFEVWHPTWLVFLSIPLVDVIADKKLTPRRLVFIAILGVYILLGVLFDEWNRAWIVLFFIPIINTIFFPNKTFKNMTREPIGERFRRYVINEERDEEN
jgi:hypothetical protein